MAYFARGISSSNASQTIKIIGTDWIDGHTDYIIEITIGQYKWTVKHRYSEFHELHEQLVQVYGLDKNLLPPKKIFGNQSSSFIKKRQGELEIYLQTLLHHLSKVPKMLSKFLDFHKYEIHVLMQNLAEELYHKGDAILQAKETYHTTPLILSSISHRRQLAEPTCETGDRIQDFGHVLDFVTQIKYLKVTGNATNIENSNINMNELKMDFSSFKSLERLELENCNCTKLNQVDHLKTTLRHIQIQNSMDKVKDFLLIGLPDGAWFGMDEESVPVTAWSALKVVDFSHNRIHQIDESLKLLPNVEYLDLSGNKLEDINHLQFLCSLVHVDVSYNEIRMLNALHTKLGNVKTLNLCGNRIESLLGFSKLYSLEELDVSNNEISQVLEIRHICKLPCLENLNLLNNPLTIVIDYRTKILELFGERSKELVLDNERASQKELDTVSIRLAIQKAKDAQPKKAPNKKAAVDAEIADGGHPEVETGHVDSSYYPGSSSDINPVQHSVNSVPDYQGPAQQMDFNLFRYQLETIREQGGDAWLTLLNQMTCRTGNSQISRRAQSPAEEARATPTRLSPESSDAVERRQTLDLKRSTSPLLARKNRQSAELTSMMLPDTLPGKSDSTFTSHLQTLLPPSALTLAELSGILDERHRREERPAHVMWCPAICYTKPREEFPACIYTTSESVHILKVHSLWNTKIGWPQVEHVYCIPILSIQQIVIGHCGAILRLEDSFSGPQGTFSFLTGSNHKLEDFVETLLMTIRRSIPEPDLVEEPHIAVNGETELNLKALLNTVECLPNIHELAIVHYMLVKSPDMTKNHKTYTTHTLVLTKKYLHLLKEDYILWPLPTFGIGPLKSPQFEIIHSFQIGTRVNGIEMYDGDTLDQSQNSLPENFMATSTLSSRSFVGFGLKLMFEIDPHNMKELDIRVSTPGMREHLLNLLTQVRKEQLNRSPILGRKQKLKKGKKHNKTPEQNYFKNETSNRVAPVADSRSSSFNSIGSLERSSSTAEECANKDSNLATEDHIAVNDPIMSNDETPTSDGSQAIATMEESPLLPPHISRLSPPTTLNLPQVYPTMSLLTHLSQCNENMSLLKTLSESMLNLATMTGEEILNFFHSKIAPIGNANEELNHVLWAMVAPYMAPKQELVTCLLLSNKAIYFVSDDLPRSSRMKYGWMTHQRNKSDSVLTSPFRRTDAHHISGIVQQGIDLPSKRVQAYYSLPLNDLKQVDISMFDQAFRLSGDTPESVFSVLTRDNSLTEVFVKRLMQVLSMTAPLTPSPAKTPNTDSEPDFYHMFNKYRRNESLEFVHASRVKFVYTNEDAIQDVIYMMINDMKDKNPPSPETSTILLYLLVFQLDGKKPDNEKGVDYSRGKPRTFIISDTHACITSEDYVNYPLPHFVKGLPDNAHFEDVEVRNLHHLRRVVVSDFHSHDLTLVFADEGEDLVVDTSLDHYSLIKATPTEEQVEEVMWKLVVQNMKDKEKLLKLLSRHYSELHAGSELSVQVNA